MLTRYKHIVIEDFKGPPDLREFEAIEQELGAALPSSFRQFLEVANGGTLKYSVLVPLLPNGDREPMFDEMTFCNLFYAGRDHNGEYGDGTLIGEVRSHRHSKIIPEKVLPFAQDTEDSTLYLDLTESGHGRIITFEAFQPVWTNLEDNDAWVEVAPTFDEYLSRLYLDDDFLEETFNLLGKAVSDGDEERVRANREYLDAAVPDWRERHKNLA